MTVIPSRMGNMATCRSGWLRTYSLNLPRQVLSAPQRSTQSEGKEGNALVDALGVVRLELAAREDIGRNGGLVLGERGGRSPGEALQRVRQMLISWIKPRE